MTNTVENISASGSAQQQIEADQHAESHKSDINEAYRPKKNWLGMILILTVPLLFGGVLYYGYGKLQAHRAADKNDHQSLKVIVENKAKSLGAEGDPLNIAPVDEPAMPPTAMPITSTGTSTATPIPVLGNSPATAKDGAANAAITPKASRYDAPIMIAQGTSPITNTGLASHTNVLSNTGIEAIQPFNASKSNKPAAEAHSNGMNLTPTTTHKAKANLLGNRNYVLAKGNTFDCALTSAINSSNPGLVTCTTTGDSYSDNGKVVLVERGSLLTGEYAGLKQGDTRLTVLWDRIKTPEGVVIELNSLGTDALGRSGFDGDINKHWTERLGAAILLSSFKDLVAYETAKNSNGTTIAFPNAQRAGEDMANQILKQTIHIPPTLTKNQGERIAIVVKRDLDFSDVYELKISGQGH
ncbi:MAG TPA: type IV secretion system protein VirB10 [Methylotenera sp.]|nr:type IV secretion system protein VirB10 [Methylotenera sp.]HPN01027.1 type IV secretion system protein VirB10 [Methylotenera sp.]